MPNVEEGKKDELTPPKADKKHIASQFIKWGIGLIPYTAGAASEIFDLFYQSGYEKRLEMWREEVSGRINQLSEKISLEKLLRDEEFHSLLTELTFIALRNHQQIKLEAALNLLSNSPLSTLDYDFKKLFAIYIDQFTGFHLRTLFMIYENQQCEGKPGHLNGKELRQRLKEDIFINDTRLMSAIMEELDAVKGLVEGKSIQPSNQNIRYLVLSHIGLSFIEMISKKP